MHKRWQRRAYWFFRDYSHSTRFGWFVRLHAILGMTHICRIGFVVVAASIEHFLCVLLWDWSSPTIIRQVWLWPFLSWEHDTIAWQIRFGCFVKFHQSIGAKHIWSMYFFVNRLSFLTLQVREPVLWNWLSVMGPMHCQFRILHITMNHPVNFLGSSRAIMPYDSAE